MFSVLLSETQKHNTKSLSQSSRHTTSSLLFQSFSLSLCRDRPPPKFTSTPWFNAPSNALYRLNVAKRSQDNLNDPSPEVLQPPLQTPPLPSFSILSSSSASTLHQLHLL
ncbi:hypothetical protein AVEN_252319-1 [Araneus ventricosus]|uniref:Uncharacterized protein n=1 Tax=Araneus ventricosus TaxID=182803 RepID=A0A4Y2ASL6_ARAVE|nr:hypothetical protein AVEN_252319-1 [Araneus ventricosus]